MGDFLLFRIYCYLLYITFSGYCKEHFCFFVQKSDGKSWHIRSAEEHPAQQKIIRRIEPPVFIRIRRKRVNAGKACSAEHGAAYHHEIAHIEHAVAVHIAADTYKCFIVCDPADGYFRRSAGADTLLRIQNAAGSAAERQALHFEHCGKGFRRIPAAGKYNPVFERKNIRHGAISVRVTNEEYSRKM